MEKLSKTQVEAIRKCSTERLRLNLLKVGEDEETLLAMDRDALLNVWAAMVAAGRDQPTAAAAAGRGRVDYDPQLERERFDFEKTKYEEAKAWEMKKYEEELAIKKLEMQQQAEREQQQAALKQAELQQQAERDKQQAELRQAELHQQAELRQAEMRQQAERDRLEAEKLELRKREMYQQTERDRLEAENKKQQLAQQAARDQAELDRQDREARRHAERDAAERAKAESMAVRIKTFGDALRNSLSIQPSDPFENISFFRNVENVFDALGVPNELRGTLLKPYLNEKSKKLVARLEANVSTDYDKIKEYLLKELQLSPATYR